MKTSDSVAAIQAAFTKAQSEMGGAVKDSANPFFKSKYADLVAVIKAIKEPFEKNDLSYMQFPITTPEGIGVITRINHKSGEFIESEFTLPLTKLDPQAAGSAITYARRYALQAICGVPAVDDDAEIAMMRHVPDEAVTQRQFVQIKTLLEKTKSDIPAFCKAFQCDKPENLAAVKFEQAMAALKRKEEQVNGKHDQASESSGQGGQIQESRPEEVLDKLRQDIQ